MAVTAARFERLLDEAPIPEERRRELWARAERLRIGVDHARAVRTALSDQRARRARARPT